jgi:two-component system chemotaxis response regulator CheY
MPKRVLSVGQCGADHYGITQYLRQHFDARVTAADREDDALERLRAGGFHLALVNRRLDVDGSDGLRIVRAIKGDPELSETPVMLVSNYPEAQQQAVAAGAEYGFGKSEYGSAEVLERLRRFLADPPDAR